MLHRLFPIKLYHTRFRKAIVGMSERRTQLNTTHELPPILRGSEQQQLAALRDYLVRLAQSLNAVDSATIVSSS